MSFSVYLSPSAQERNVGVRGYGTEEKRMNQVADVVEDVLVKHGIKVYRNKPEWSLAEIVEDSNRRKPDLHFAIHSNAGGGQGCEIYAYSSASKGATAARIIYSQMEPLTPSKDRGVKYSTELYELRKTMSPAVLIEVGFHDDPGDAIWIMNNTDIIGTTLAVGVMKYLGVQYDKDSIADKPKLTDKPKPVSEPKTAGVYAVVNEYGVNFRSGPGTRTKILGRLKKGDKVRLIKKVRVWWLVEHNLEKGYVYDKYISFEDN